MVCELLTCCTSSSVGPSQPAAWQSQRTASDRFRSNGATVNGDVRDQLPACEMVVDIIGDLFTHGRQLKHLVFDDRIVGLLGELIDRK